MKKIIIPVLTISVLLIISNQLRAQYIMGLDDYIDYSNITRTNAPASNPYEDINGSPFLSDGFVTGKIVLKNGKTYQGPLRYDIYGDQIEFKTNNGEIYAVNNPETIDRVILGDSHFQYFVKDKENDLNGVYEQLVSGKFSLLAKHVVVLKDATPAKPYSEAKPASFVKKDNKYFILDENGKVYSLKNKKDLYSIQNQIPGALKKYVKENNISINSQDDLTRFILYLNGK